MSRDDPAFKIKNANFPLFVLHMHTTDMDRFKLELEASLKQTPAFFSNTPVVLGLAALAESGFVPDFADLAAFMRAHGMQTAGVSGGSEAQEDAAAAAGLGIFPENQPRRAEPKSEPEPEPKIAAPEKRQPAAAVAAPVAPPAPELRPTLVVDKPVRTGQRIYAKDANLVVLAIVNPGAELIADGDIHIYAPLRGRAIAGAHGNEGARIFVHRLEAELISIAGCFQVFEQGVPEHVRGKPAQVRLEGTRLIFEALPE